MKLIFIYGMPATGKLTVAKELPAASRQAYGRLTSGEMFDELYEGGTLR